MPRQAPSRNLARIILALAICAATAWRGPAAGAAGPSVPALAPEQRRTLESLLSALRDRGADALRRRQAARALLDLKWPAADSALRLELATSPDAVTQRAIVQAVGQAAQPSPALAPVLLDMLRIAGEPLWTDLAEALGRYDAPEVVDQVIALALDARAGLSGRLGAVAALAHRHEPAAVAALVQLTEPREPAPVRQAAFAALTRATGVADLGHDGAAWRRWWDSHRGLDGPAWNQALLGNFERGRQAMIGQLQQMQERLVEAQRQLYRLQPADKRPAMLVALLADPLEALRLLGLALTRQLLDEATGVPPDVRAALVARLDDPSFSVRLQAAVLALDLADETAASKLAGVLAAGTEKRAELLRVYLLLLKRVPRATAIEAGLGLLEDPAVGREAAQMLSAGAEAGLLTPADKHRARAFLRNQMGAGRPVDPTMVGLLGKVADAADWEQIIRWLDNTDSALKQAAAQALGQSDRPLAPLVERGADPVIYPVLLDAAARRETEAATLRFLATHPPQTEALGQAWQRALVAVAGRAAPRAVLEAAADLGDQAGAADLRTRMLSAALEQLGSANPAAADPPPTQPAPEQAEVLASLLVARAEVHLSAGNARAAAADCERAAAPGAALPAHLVDRIDLVLLKARLALGEPEGLDLLTRRVLRREAPAPAADRLGQVAGLYIDAARRQAAGGQADAARRLVSLLRPYLSGGLSAAQAAAWSDLERSLGLATPPTQPLGATQPAATEPAAAPRAVP